MAREDFTDTVGVLEESGHPGFADYSLVGSPEHLREFLAALQKGLEVAPKREMVSVFQGGEPTAETVEVKLPQVSLLAADLTGGRDWVTVHIVVDADIEERRRKVRRSRYADLMTMVVLGAGFILALVGLYSAVGAVFARLMGPQ